MVLKSPRAMRMISVTRQTTKTVALIISKNISFLLGKDSLKYFQIIFTIDF